MIMMDLKKVQNTYFGAGRVEFISIRPARAVAVEGLKAVNAIQNKGLEGDHYKNEGGNRQVTLVQAEHLNVVASLLGESKIEPEKLRRNIVVSGINLVSLKTKQFKVGEAVLACTGECHPCTRMEENLGPGGYNAMRGHGGITAKIIKGGIISIGDEVSIIKNSAGENDLQSTPT
jgi:MOSC domain-containing protein YiiM